MKDKFTLLLVTSAIVLLFLDIAVVVSTIKKQRKLALNNTEANTQAMVLSSTDIGNDLNEEETEEGEEELSPWEYYEASESEVEESSLNSIIVQANNSKFDPYIGNRLSSARVKQFFSLINTNNITASTGGEYKTIGVHFKFISDGNTIDYPQGDDIYLTDIKGMTTYVKGGNYYKVTVPGEKAYNAEANGNNGFVEDDNGIEYTDNGCAYYSTGYYRLFYIEQLEE